MTGSAITPQAAARCFLGVDVGGTFTDLVFFADSGEITCVKVPSTPATPGISTLNGIEEVRVSAGVSQETWAALLHTHSSTVATNALIERSGARLGLIVTTGFRDILEIQRLATPKPMRYDSRRPQPLVPREMVAEVAERIDAVGRVLTPLDEAAVEAAARSLAERSAQLVVICFLHSYMNPAHERRAREVIGSSLPDLKIELSSDVWPQAREYERATLAVINAYVRPTVEAHVRQLSDGLAERGILTAPRGARSNGGMELLSTMARRPVVALLSGPAAGVAGAAAAAAEAGWEAADLMTIDVGGTSADIGVVRGGRPILSTEEHIADFPILVPSIAVSAIGAGGGSIIWLDETRSLKVGPRSAGADPGPACYGAGATEPTLTDAFLLAGFLTPDQRLGGKLTLHRDPARRALASVGSRIGWTAEQVADGAIRVATAMMAAEATNVLARRGVDVPKFRMVAYGGAGPLVAALLAEDIYVDTVLVPPTPGALSALGAARADLEGDFVRPIYRLLDDVVADDWFTELDALHASVAEWLVAECDTLPVADSLVEFSADMRYDGQGYDVNLQVSRQRPAGDLRGEIASAFHDAHRAVFGHANEDARIWVKELRAHVIGRLSKPATRVRASIERSAAVPRTVRLRGRELMARAVDRAALVVGDRLDGPAVIPQMDTTTLVPDGWSAGVAASGALILSRTGAL